MSRLFHRVRRNPAAPAPAPARGPQAASADAAPPASDHRPLRLTAEHPALAALAPSAASPSGWQLARRAATFVRPFGRTVAGLLALALLVAAANAAEPLVLRHLFDALGAGEGVRPLLLSVATLLAIEIGRALVNARLSAVTWDVRLGVDLEVRQRVVRKLTRLPMSYHQHASVGGTMQTLNQALTGFVSAFSDVAFNVLPTLVYFVLSLVAMWHLDPRLCLVVLAFAPLPAIVGARAAREQTARERTLLAHWSGLYSRLAEVLGGIRAVKTFVREEGEVARFVDGQRAGNAIVQRGARTDARTDVKRGLAATLARLAALGVGGFLVARGELTLGTLVAFLGYIGGLFGPVQGLTTVYQTLRKATVSLETIFRILDTDEVVQDAPDAVPAPPLQGAITFDRVSFAYSEGTPVLKDVTLDIRPGEMIALVGPSGSGKTTLASLLQRLYPVTEGRILVDGHDIATLQKDSLCRQIGVVFQDAYLFQDTVRANIAYGLPDASQDEIEMAARLANAHDFIMQLPEGYDTMVGERGSRLSGGQRQRIAIARALLLGPPLLILDEATSALDAESEALVQEAIHHLVKGRTTIVIAHRLSTVVHANRVIVLRDGQISEEGDHASLVRSGGYYASLVAQQTEGLLLVA